MKQLFSIVFSVCFLGAFAQDTLPMRIADAEKLFIAQNADLLLAKLQISVAEAQAIQAKLFPNPTLSVEQNIYNPGNQRYFDVTKTGQSIVAVSQLFQLAGKRNKAFQLAQTEIQLNEFAYYDLLRTLKFELNRSFYAVDFLLQQDALLSRQVDAIKGTLVALDMQFAKGNISLKEIIRLKALLLDIQSQQNDLNTQLAEQESALRILLKTKTTVFVKPILPNASSLSKLNYEFQNLYDTALFYRSDYLIQQTQKKFAEQNLKYEKAQAVPDLHLGAVYDRAGSFVQNYRALTVSFDLPVFNRNQGNIKAASLLKEAGDVSVAQKTQSLQEEVYTALAKFKQSALLFASVDQNFVSDFDKLIDAVSDNYARRNISLLEFIDFYETYNESSVKNLEIQFKLRMAHEELSLTVGKSLSIN